MKKLSICILLFSLACFAEDAKLLDRFEDSFQARVDLIKQAKESIYISSYAFHDDEMGAILLSLLHYQAQRGITVKVLVDDLGSKINSYLNTALNIAGAEIYLFNKKSIRRPVKTVKYRMHDKLFIVDNQYLIMGGRNSKKVYYGIGEIPFRDRDIFYHGAIASSAQKYFLDLHKANHIKRARVITIKNARDFKKLEKVQAALKTIFNRLEARNFKVFSAGLNWDKDLQYVENPTFVHDEIRLKKKKMSGTSKKLMDLIKAAESEVLIDSPYFILTPEWHEIFKNLRGKGVKIRFLTNSLMATTSRFSFPQAGYLASKTKILALGIDLFEYYTKETLHAKTVVIDNKIGVIGSYNFDPRSQNLNTEVISFFYDIQMARKLKSSMNDALTKARKIGADGKPIGSEKEFPETSRMKVIRTRIIQYLIFPIFKDLF